MCVCDTGVYVRVCACISNSGWSAALLCPAAEAAVWCEVGDRRQGQPGGQVLCSQAARKKPGTTTKMLRSNSLPCEEYGKKDRKQENQEKRGRGQPGGQVLCSQAARCYY